jgi:hypothetical protein
MSPCGIEHLADDRVLFGAVLIAKSRECLPKLTHVGRSSRALICAVYEVETGLELRATYKPDDVMRTELFRRVERDERLAATAETWRLALAEKGFAEIKSL